MSVRRDANLWPTTTELRRGSCDEPSYTCFAFDIRPAYCKDQWCRKRPECRWREIFENISTHKFHHESINQSINPESINQSVSQSVSQSINQLCLINSLATDKPVALEFRIKLEFRDVGSLRRGENGSTHYAIPAPHRVILIMLLSWPNYGVWPSLQVKSLTRLSAVSVTIITCTDHCPTSFSVIQKRWSISRPGPTTSLMSFAGKQCYLQTAVRTRSSWLRGWRRGAVVVNTLDTWSDMTKSVVPKFNLDSSVAAPKLCKSLPENITQAKALNYLHLFFGSLRFAYFRGRFSYYRRVFCASKWVELVIKNGFKHKDNSLKQLIIGRICVWDLARSIFGWACYRNFTVCFIDIQMRPWNAEERMEYIWNTELRWMSVRRSQRWHVLGRRRTAIVYGANTAQAAAWMRG